MIRNRISPGLALALPLALAVTSSVGSKTPQGDGIPSRPNIVILYSDDQGSNSGGGVIVIGLTSGGHPSGATVTHIAALDPADLVNRVSKYTGRQFVDFGLVDCEKEGNNLVAITLAPAATPFVFEKPGTYAVSQKNKRLRSAKGLCIAATVPRVSQQRMMT